jgi:hypothetical protein
MAGVNGSFCTYFDHWYLTRGLALARSLQRHRRGARLWVLCLTDLCFEVLRRLAPAGVRPLHLRDLEVADPALAAARRDRTVMEYYFTCTPALPLYLLEHERDLDLITYLDADLFFFEDPEPLFSELGERSVAIVPHRFPPRLRELERHGIYNVGWLTFRRDERGLTCLRWWRERCLEWCHDRVEPGRFAEQKYLDDWPQRFPGVVALRHPGANVAPWNLEAHRLTLQGERVRVDGEPLIFYHAHGLQEGRVPDPGLDQYGVALTPLVRDHVYGPYLRALDQERLEVDAVLEAARRGQASFSPAALADLADYDRALPEREVVRQARRATLQRLEECERDRAARLQQIERREARLAQAEADRTARLRDIDSLGRQLAVSESDRGARLKEIQRLGGELARADADRAARLHEIERLAADLAQADADRSARLLEVQRLQAQLAETEAACAASARSVEGLSQELERLGAELQRLREANAQTAAEADAASAQLLALQASRSWRWTAPLRALSARLLRRSRVGP